MFYFDSEFFYGMQNSGTPICFLEIIELRGRQRPLFLIDSGMIFKRVYISFNLKFYYGEPIRKQPYRH